VTDVVALVLTHNSPVDLMACAEALRAQTHAPSRIVVVDSASRPPARVPDGVEVLRLDQNLGPAGGHARGLEAFLGGPGDAAWVLDDDMIPDPACLRHLVEALAESANLAIGFPAVFLDGAPTPAWYPAWCGVLLPRSVVEAVGVPRAELFWWAEDTEYLQWRMRERSVRVVRVPEAHVVHRRSRAAAGRPAWKVYYEVRNSVYYRLRVQGLSRRTLARLVRALGRLVGQVLFREDHKARKLWLFARGLMDGVRGRLGIRVAVPDGTADSAR
jgi:rhamnopyranosyl-N-acetylglucosaminyl-diphospho-decaprenol beta-1,3/1,4-galactofuranosyltransferase